LDGEVLFVSGASAYPMRSAVMAHLQYWAGPALRLLRSPAMATAAGSTTIPASPQWIHLWA
jgi:hypothetical protein